MIAIESSISVTILSVNTVTSPLKRLKVVDWNELKNTSH